MSFDPIRNYTELLEAHGVFALVIIFIFIVERRAIADLNKTKDPELRTHYLRNHRSAERVRNVLLVPAVLVWGYSLFHPLDRPKLIKMLNLSTGKYTVDVTPTVRDLEFYTRKVDGGQMDWDLHPKSSERTWRFTAYQTPLVKPAKSPVPLLRPGAGSRGPLLLGKKASNASTPPTEAQVPIPPPEMKVELDVSASGADQYEYRLDDNEDATKMGHFYARRKEDWIPIPWDGEVAKPPNQRGELIRPSVFDLLRLVFAQTPLCPENGMPKDKEQVLNDLGSRDLSVRLSIRSKLVAAGSGCAGFLEYAAQHTSSAINRDRLLLVDSLNEVLIESKNPGVSNKTYAELGQQNYALGNYDRAIQFWKYLDGNYLKAEPGYLFYLGYAQTRLNRNEDAIKSFDDFSRIDKNLADEPAVLSSFGDAYYQLGLQKQAQKDISSACEAYKRALDKYTLAIKKDRSLESGNEGFWRKASDHRIAALQCK